MTKNQRLWAAFIGLQLLFTLTMIGSVEALLRWRINRLPAQHVPSGWDVPVYRNNHGVVVPKDPFDLSIRYTLNSSGLRGKELGPKTKKRILVLGDSVAFGVIVQDRDTFPKQLEDLLGGTYEVINGAASGYDLWDYEGYLKQEGLGFEPDLVVVGVYVNDNTRVSQFHAPAESGKGARLREMLRESKLVKTLMYAVGSRFNKHSPFAFTKGLNDAQRKVIASFFPGDDESARAIEKFLADYKYALEPMVLEYLPVMLNSEAWKKTLEPMQGIAKLCKDKKIPVLAVVFPAQFEVYPGYRWPQPHEQIAGLLKEAAIPSLDLSEPFRQGGADELYPFRSDTSHPAKKGYAIAAAQTFEKLKSLGWLSR